jgi:hypothetical protein
VRTARAVLIALATADGLVSAKAGTPLGKVYTVDLATRKTRRMYNVEHHRTHVKEIIRTVDGTAQDGWYPTEMLRIEEDGG